MPRHQGNPPTWRGGVLTIDTWSHSERTRVVRELAVKSTHQLARELGLSQSTLYGWAKRNGVPLARRGGLKLAARKGRAA